MRHWPNSAVALNPYMWDGYRHKTHSRPLASASSWDQNGFMRFTRGLSLIGLLFLPALAHAESPAVPGPVTVQARPADELIDRIGVNTHFGYSGGVYDKRYDTVAEKLGELVLGTFATAWTRGRWSRDAFGPCMKSMAFESSRSSDRASIALNPGWES